MPTHPETGQVEPHENCMAESNLGRGGVETKFTKTIDQQV